MIIILMGVSGSGKTTVGRELAGLLGWPFLDADDFHPAANIEKMRSGIALSEEDRLPWLHVLSDLVGSKLERDESAVLACSALSRESRRILRRGSPLVRFVYLKAAPELIRSRLKARPGHFMPPHLLESQFQALQEPEQALTVDASSPPQKAARSISLFLFPPS